MEELAQRPCVEIMCPPNLPLRNYHCWTCTRDFKNTKEKEVMFVGVDVSKETLDVYRPDTGEYKNPKYGGRYQRPLQGVEDEKRFHPA